MKQSDLQNPVALAKIIAASNANTIPVDATNTSYASQTEGFPAITMKPKIQGGEPPHGMDFNGFIKLLSSHVFNIQNGSPETFNPEVSNLIGGYPKNAQLWLIRDSNSRLLKSTKDDNTDNFLTTPSVIGTSWIDAFPTKDYVDNNFVTTNTSQTITGVKTFSLSPQVPTSASGDSSANAANTEFVTSAINTLLSTLYPIGSTYISTQSTCPLATLISGSTWSIVGTAIVTSVNSNVPIKGTGKAIGIMGGNGVSGSWVSGTGGSGDKRITVVNNQYNLTVNDTSYSATDISSARVIGLATNASNSGIVGTITSANFTVNIWQRTA